MASGRAGEYGSVVILSLRLPKVLAKGQELRPITRKPSASPAPGSKKKFDKSQTWLVREALGIN